MEKICALRKTKANPNVYLRSEVNTIAKEKGISAKIIRESSKQDLCNLLSIEWKGGDSRQVKPKDPVVNVRGIPCNTLKSKKNPEGYTKTDLVNMMMKYFKISEATAKRMTKTEMCIRIRDLIKKLKKKKGLVSPEKVISPQSSPKRALPDCITNSKVPLNEHQIRVSMFLQNNRGVIAAHQTGSGKTLTAVAASQCVLEMHPDWKVLVVTPTSLQENFKKEMRKYGIDANDKRYTYMTIGKFANLYKTKPCHPKTLLIIDEAHNLRTRTDASKRSKSTGKKVIPRSRIAINCAKKVGKVLLLTATPLYNDPYDLVNLVSMVSGIDPPTKKQFDFSIMTNPRLFKEFFKCVLSVYDPIRGPEFPSSKEHEISLKMTDSYFKAYSDIEAKNSALMGNDPWVFLTGMRQATNALKGCIKCNWVMNKLKDGTKTVIYSAFITNGIDILKNLLNKSNIKYVEITGKNTKADRDKVVTQFNKPSEPNVLFITKAGSEGLDLKGVRNVIHLERSWNRMGELQINGRAVRYLSHHHLPDKERKVNIYYLTLDKPKIDVKPVDYKESADRMLAELIKKKEMNQSVIRDKLINLSIEKNDDCMTISEKELIKSKKDIFKSRIYTPVKRQKKDESKKVVKKSSSKKPMKETKKIIGIAKVVKKSSGKKPVKETKKVRKTTIKEPKKVRKTTIKEPKKVRKTTKKVARVFKQQSPSSGDETNWDDPRWG
jgi:superfamily II DNA/RNA helicase